MKTLIVVRHAKSSWAIAGQDDFDRPLNDRGKKDAPEMAARLKDKGIEPDLLVSSPAKRAKKTAAYFAEAFKIDKDDILLVDRLYAAPAVVFGEVVTGLDDRYATVAVFAHNPGITEFANTLTNVRVDDMPTCAVFALQAKTDRWAAFGASEKNFLFFDYPKNPLESMG